ncbi:MAG TPA: serine hydrolase domain-containing protein [Labilithrix sp.]|nr:serine hydrolase domain-containing protein [Labilithrix sp.]
MFSTFRKHAARRTASLLALLLPVLLSSCGSSEVESSVEPSKTSDGTPPSNVPSVGSPATDGGGTSPVTEGGVPLPPCDDAETAALQKSFDAAHPSDTDAVLVVRTACGVRFFTSGPSKYPATTLHRIASNTKTYVASLVLLLAEDGVIGLDSPASQWVEGVPGGTAIKVRHLLRHDSGLYDYTNSVLLEGRNEKVWTPRELADISFKHKVEFAPGEGWSYSNSNYVVLGMIAEKATGKPVEVLIRERILGPIGATATFFEGKEALPTQLAVGRDALGRDITNINHPSQYWCAGSLVATPGDLALWVEARGSGKFHSAKVNAELEQTLPTSATKDYRYGLGVMVFGPDATRGAGPGYGHGGDLFGYHSWGLYFPESKTTVALVIDSDKGTKGVFPFASSNSRDLLYATLDTLFGKKK